jgi:chorismate mutase
MHTRIALCKAMGLSEEFTTELLKLIHHESIQIQTKVMNSVAERV